MSKPTFHDCAYILDVVANQQGKMAQADKDPNLLKLVTCYSDSGAPEAFKSWQKGWSEAEQLLSQRGILYVG